MRSTYRLFVQCVLGSDCIGLLIDSYAYNRLNTSQVANVINSGSGLPWPILWNDYHRKTGCCFVLRYVVEVKPLESCVWIQWFFWNWINGAFLPNMGCMVQSVNARFSTTKGNLDVGFLVRSPGESFFLKPNIIVLTCQISWSVQFPRSNLLWQPIYLYLDNR